MNAARAERKAFLTTFWLAIFLGMFGADRFYLDQKRTAYAKLMTGGGLGLWTIVDVIYTLSGKRRDGHSKKLVGLKEHQETIIWSMPVGIGIGILPFAYQDRSDNWARIHTAAQGDTAALVLGLVIAGTVLLGAFIFFGFNIVDAVRRKLWLWAVLNTAFYLLGLGVFSMYYYFSIRGRVDAVSK
jgi:TM2 domain-containing membrane protein YozV